MRFARVAGLVLVALGPSVLGCIPPAEPRPKGELAPAAEGRSRLPPGHPPIEREDEEERLPPGHPPVTLAPGRPEARQLPPGHPQLEDDDDDLPPGHPPVRPQLPPGHPKVPGGLPPGHPPVNGQAPAPEPLWI
jgi:hypothetical protein